MRILSRLVALSALVGAITLPSVASAQFEELENPGTVSAVQARKFRLNHELDLGVGILPWDAFYKGLTLNLGYTYHFTDHFAWRVGRGTYSYELGTGLREQLERDFNVNPTRFEVVEWMAGSDLVWNPVYGKFAWMNGSVLHFAGALSAGGTVVKFNTGFRPAVNLGIGARLFTSQRVSFRLDLSDNIVVADRILHVPTVQLSTALNFGATE